MCVIHRDDVELFNSSLPPAGTCGMCVGCVIGLFLFQINEALSDHNLIAFEYEQPDVVKSRPFVELSDRG
jgi:hypothetical protein